MLERVICVDSLSDCCPARRNGFLRNWSSASTSASAIVALIFARYIAASTLSEARRPHRKMLVSALPRRPKACRQIGMATTSTFPDVCSAQPVRPSRQKPSQQTPKSFHFLSRFNFSMRDRTLLAPADILRATFHPCAGRQTTVAVLRETLEVPALPRSDNLANPKKPSGCRVW